MFNSHRVLGKRFRTTHEGQRVEGEERWVQGSRGYLREGRGEHFIGKSSVKRTTGRWILLER